MGVSPDDYLQQVSGFRVLQFCLIDRPAFERCINIIG